jgi:hypothetical protein
MVIRSRSVLLSLVASLLLTGALQAQATRTWVSGVGDDANPCSRTAPCKTFAGAISKTATGGEISVLDPGGFGAVTITKAITINGEGTLAGILSATVNGIIVNAPATATVYIHNISINGASSGLDGIRVLAAGTVVVEHSWIYGVTSDGIEVAAAGTVNLKVNDTTIENVGQDCIRLNTTAGQVAAMINNSRLQNCVGSGLNAIANVRAGIRDTVVTNSSIGLKTTGSDGIINVENVFITFCATGIKSIASGTASHIRVSNSNIAQNGTGLDTSLGGTIDSFQGNSLDGNTTPGLFSTTTNKQ